MKRMTNRILVSTIGLIFLLSACAPAPAATQAHTNDQADMQKALDPQSQDNAVVQFNLPMENAVFAAQNAQATQTPSSTLAPTAILSPLQLTVDAWATEQSILPTNTLAPATETPTPTEDPDQLELFDLTPKPKVIDTCIVTIIKENSKPEKYRLPARQPELGDLQNSEIVIVNPVNLRTGPGVSYRFITTLRPFATSDPQTPGPTATSLPRTKYRIIGGPVYTDLGGDIPGENPRFRVANRVYKWWKIESLNKALTGWIAEASACGLYYFIEKN